MGSWFRRRATGWRRVAVVAASVVAGGLVLWVFLSLYVSRHYASPVALDTLKYIWRTRLTAADGFHAIAQVPAGTTLDTDRPGLPAIGSLVQAVLGISPYRLMFVLAPVAAVMIGLGAAALMVRATGEPWWSFPVYLLAVGASMNVALMANGYLDNIVAATVLVGAAVAGLLAADGRRGVAATGLLLAGGAVIHWQFTLLFLAIMGGLVILLLPESWLAWRRGRRLHETPAARLGAGLLGGTAGIGAVALLWGPLEVAHATRGSFVNKLNLTAPTYRFPVVGPAAGAGVAAVAVPPRPRRLRSLALLLVWGASAAVSVWVLSAGRTVAAHRIVAFALAVPILATATVIGAVRLLAWLAGRIRGRGRAFARPAAAVVGAIVVLGALAASTGLTRNEWFSRAHPALVVAGYPGSPPTEARAIAEAARAGRYVQRDGRGLPVVYVVETGDVSFAASALDTIRDAVPADQIARTAVYVGRVADLLAGRPTLSQTGDRVFDLVSEKFWAGSRELARRAIVIELRSYDRRLVQPPRGHRDPGGWIARGVWLVRGPRPSLPVPAVSPPTASAPAVLALEAVGLLVLVGVVGSGWSAWLLDDVPAAMALAPAFGVAVLCLGGVLADRAGLRLDGPVGVTLVVVAVALGWAWLPVTRWRATGGAAARAGSRPPRRSRPRPPRGPRNRSGSIPRA